MTEPKVMSFGSAKEGLPMLHHDAVSIDAAGAIANEGRLSGEQFELGKCPG
jgi:hypothetical protein